MHETPCDTLIKCKETTEERMDRIEEKLDSIHDMIEAWDNAKGFISVIRMLSKIAIWCGATGAAITASTHFIRHFGGE